MNITLLMSQIPTINKYLIVNNQIPYKVLTKRVIYEVIYHNSKQHITTNSIFSVVSMKQVLTLIMLLLSTPKILIPKVIIERPTYHRATNVTS